MLKRYIAPKMKINKFINITKTIASAPVNYVTGFNDIDNKNKTKIKLDAMAEITRYNF